MTEPLMVEVYHPGLDRKEVMPASSLPHLRQSGWLLASEHAENQAAADAAAAKTAPKSEGK